MKRKFLICLVVLAVMAATSLVNAQQEVKVGIVLPMSGPLAKIGLTNLWGHELAIADINKAIEIQKDYAEAYYVRAICNGELGNIEKAAVDFDKVLSTKREPTDQP